MNAFEETYKKIDPEGEVNMAFDDAEFKESLNQIDMSLVDEVPSTKKSGKNALEA
jgi:hypothetical protein